jgi:type I restriction enzyme M protein
MKKTKDKLDVSAAAASLQSVPEGKVVDFVSGRLLDDTPEEYVRQNIEMSLVLEYGYDRSQLEIEFPIKVGSARKRVDIAIFPRDAQHVQTEIVALVETKKHGTNRNDKKEGIEQLWSYMSACFKCEDGMWTNGEDRACFRRIEKDGKHEPIPSIDLPVPGAKSAQGPTRHILRAASGDNLLFTFRRCHNYIAGNQGLQKPEAFWELLKLIFCKIEDERSPSVNLEFYTTEGERGSMNGQAKVKARLQKLFREKVITKYPTIFKAGDDLEMLPSVVAYVVSELQQYSLLRSPVDVKGVAYEEVVGSNLRGDRGEFFTPRNACRMAVKMISPRETERILDPACGTGGFLVTAMNYVLADIEEDERKLWLNPDAPLPHERERLYERKKEYLQQKVVGLDLNPNLVRAAKMNMVMNNDGSGSLFQCNSLEHPHRFPADVIAAKIAPDSFDVVFTNPPFGTNIIIDDPRVLKQYDVAAQWEDKGTAGSEIRRNAKGEPLLQSSQPPEILFLERCLQFLKPGTGRMAIVLPNGILNNPGLKYLRQSLFNKAQILAVVDMHRDLFMPKNDTQCSMVLLRRRAPGEKVVDYPIFMAVADKIGHDKRGQHIYKRSPDGKEIFAKRIKEAARIVDGELQKYSVEVLEPVVDDELDDVAEAYLDWLSKTAKRQKGAHAG